MPNIFGEEEDKDWKTSTCELYEITNRTDLIEKNEATAKVLKQIGPCLEEISKQYP